MTERYDYLFDPTATPDPEVQALERALRPLASTTAPWRGDPQVATPKPRRWPWLAAAAALAAIALAVVFWRERGLAPGGAPRVFVAAKTPEVIALGELAEITLLPGSELRFVHWRKEQALFHLERGALEARVVPPPKVEAGFFAVDTALGRVVDQGCRYELVLQDDGSAYVRVTEGAVTFVVGDRTVFVPVGAEVTVARDGARTPVFTDSTAELRKAVREFDHARATKAELAQREMSLKLVLAAARRPRDSLVLWHLLKDDEPIVRAAAEQLLLDLVGPPDGGKTKQEHFEPEEWLPFLRLGAWQAGG